MKDTAIVEYTKKKIKSIPGRAWLSLFLLSLFSHGIAQTADSIIQSLPDDLPGKAKVDSLNKMGFDLVFTNPGEARLLFNESYAIAKETHYKEGEAKALKNKAISFDLQGNSNEAIHSYLKALQILEDLKDTVGIAKLKNNIGIAYKNLSDFKHAYKFYEESISLKKILGDVKGVAYGYNNIGELHAGTKQYEKALQFFHKAYIILDSLHDTQGRSTTLSNLGDMYLELGEYRLAIGYALLSEKIEKADKDYYNLSLTYILLARSYLGVGELSKALESIEKAEKITQDLATLRVYYQSQLIKAKLLKQKGDIHLLPALYEKILVLSDSLAKVNLAEETAKTEALYESREKEIIIENLKKESFLNEELIEQQQQRYILSLVAIFLLVSTLVLILFYYKSSRRKNYDLQLKIAELDKAQKALFTSEARFKLQIQRMPIGHITWTPDFKVSSWNPSAEKIFGFTKNEMLGRHPYGYIVPKEEQPVVDVVWKRLLEGDISAHSINSNTTKNGRTIFCDWTNTPLRNAEGKVFSILSMVTDITERKKVEEEIMQAKEQAESANRAKSEFLANMSHEIRTPMNAILGFSEILPGSLDNPKFKSYVDHISNAGKNLLVLINDILDLSKIEAGKLELNTVSVDLRVFVNELKNMFSVIQERKKIKFNINISPALPGHILIDGIRLRQVLYNLLGNAFKFTEKGTIALTVTHAEEQEQKIVFEVADTGIGISPNDHELIFEAFRQQDGQITRKYGGTGLGLTITKRLVELMGGAISVKSQKGYGSTFIVTLPFLASVEKSELNMSPDEDKLPRATKQFTVLIAEDNAINMQMIQEVLSGFDNLRILEAENGEEAVQIAIKEKPNLVFMDLMMPGLDGYQANRKLKENQSTAHIPVIAWTAAGLREDEKKIKAEFQAMLRKPSSIKEIQDVLLSFLASADRN